LPRPLVRTFFLAGAALLAAAVATMLLRRPPAVAIIVVDPAVRHQTIDGWAVNLRQWEEDKANDRYDRTSDLHLDRIYRFLADSVGINAVRLEIPSGMENRANRWARFRAGELSYREWQTTRFEKVNDNDDPAIADTTGFLFDGFDHRVEHMLLPLKRAVEARGEKLYVNVNYVDFKWNASNVQGPLSHADRAEEFAEFVLVYFQRLRDKYGIVPDAFEVILEPENTERWRGPTIGRALVAAADRLKANGFTPEIVAPSNTSMSNAIQYFDGMIRVPGVLGRLGNFSYHRYRAERLADVRAIRARAKRYGLKTSMLEKVDAGIDVLLEDLVEGDVSSWQQWAAAGKSTNPDNGGYYARVDVSDTLRPVLSFARHTHQLAPVFQLVRRGAVRVGSTSNRADRPSAAFIGADGRVAVIVRVRGRGGRITVRGLPPGGYALRVVGDDHRARDLPAATVGAGAELDLELTDPGVLTIHGDAAR
jgi:hypothetical protein